MQKQQLKTKQTWESLELNYLRDEPLTLRANSKIDHQEVRVFGLVRHGHACGNRVLRVLRKLRHSQNLHDLSRRSLHFAGERWRQKDRRLGDSKIGRPFFRLVYAPQQRLIFGRREIGVETSSKLRMHLRSMPSHPRPRSYGAAST